MNSDHVDTDPAEDPPFQISFEMVTTAIAEKSWSYNNCRDFKSPWNH